jgi:hypothetical protein
MSALDDYKIFLNIMANSEDGISGDIISQWAKARSQIHIMDQQKMTPPVPPEITDPRMSQEPQMGEPMAGKYDDL